MNSLPHRVLLLAGLVLSSATVFAQSHLQQQRIEASYVLALGRAPSAAEIAALEPLGALSVADLLARHRQQLQGDAAVARATVTRACRDALGREPRAAELTPRAGEPVTYTELMKQHLQQLAQHPADYEQVVERAYQRVLHRPAYPAELTYWKGHDTLSYALLTASIENWARRNAPGLMETSGTATVAVSSEYLSTCILSPAVAAEARIAAGLVHPGNPDLAAAIGCNLVAVGANDVVTAGRMHFVAAGNTGVVSANQGM